MPSQQHSDFARRLLAWFDRHGRHDLPWQRNPTPYRVWVSEIMLQQTRVDTVVRYYDEFLRRFPTVVVLADADEQEVLQQWSGLGYYRRARLLHRGARHVVAEFEAQVPDEPELLRSIPGIGEYTAGAIASIAFDRPAPLVDGNVARVLSRIDSSGTKRSRGTASIASRMGCSLGIPAVAAIASRCRARCLFAISASAPCSRRSFCARTRRPR